MTFRKPFLAIALLLIPYVSSYSQPDKQRNPNSPVFKNYRPPTPAPRLEQSDATYQLWQGFRVQQKANAGDAVSQFELSIRYLTGRGFKADTMKAAYWTKKAAEQNHLLARYNLGIFQFNGWGTEWNPFDAYRNFRFAAERSMPDAQFIVAQFMTENLVVPKDWNEAYRWVKLAADSGYIPAKESLKEFERRGYHSPADTSRAALPGDTQHPPSSHSGTLQLPFLNFSPDTVKQPADSILVDDVLKAAALSQMKGIETIAASITVRDGKLEIDSSSIHSLQQAAEGGSPEALVLLGRISEQAEDIVRAAMLYARAVRLDSPRASRLLFMLLQEEDFFALLRTRVNANDENALFVWPCLISLGFDRQITDTQARQMLERAVSLNSPLAMVEMGLCSYSGKWMKRDERKAEALWRKAADLGNKEAATRLAILKIRGKKKDFAYAIPILQQAMREGSILAEFAIAYCFETGIGLPQNKGEAARLYRSSGQRGSQDAFRALQRMYDEIRPSEKLFQLRG